MKGKRGKLKPNAKPAHTASDSDNDTSGAEPSAIELETVGTTIQEIKTILETLLEEKLAKFEESLL